VYVLFVFMAVVVDTKERFVSTLIHMKTAAGVADKERS
jgi:hypothetical protein